MTSKTINIIPWKGNPSSDQILKNFKETFEGGDPTSLQIQTEGGLIFLKDVKSIQNHGEVVLVFHCTAWYKHGYRTNGDTPVEVMINTNTGHGFITDLSTEGIEDALSQQMKNPPNF